MVLGEDGLPTWRTIVGENSPERAELLAALPYKIDAIRDDSPFFFCQFRWSDLLYINTRDLGPAHTSALGQLVLAVLPLLLSLMSVIFILGPLLVFRRRAIVTTGVRKLGILGYFLAIGFGFMLFEISLIQRFILYLGYPTYSLSVVLFALLTFLGIGSYLSRRWIGTERIALPIAFVILAAFTFFLIHGLAYVQDWTLDQSLAVRVIITLMILAPLGITLGIFFPLGIRRANALHRDLVPWAWGINGCASVTAAVLAVVLAMSYGFVFVWMLSLFIYLIGIASIYGQFDSQSATSK